MAQKTDQISNFRSEVLDFYHTQGRHNLPWRELFLDGHIEPYKILISEVMLQQTQVNRVIPKYHKFLELFPTVRSLATAELSNVLIAWSGLGYNRRAKYLHQTAQIIHEQFQDQVPSTIEALSKLPGVGLNTAAAIYVYSFNKPAIFIETNIRTVFLHHFFNNKDSVSDSELLPIVKKCLPDSSFREWYWALMDYGSYLKMTVKNPSRRSKHYKIQTKFAGSKRQLRGVVLKLLNDQNLTRTELQQSTDDNRLDQVLTELLKEGLISEKSGIFTLG